MKLLLKWKVWRIESSLRSLVFSQGLKPMIWSFGAYYIDPRHLVFVVGVPTDKDKLSLKSNISFSASMIDLLNTYNWPKEARTGVVFDVESQETVNRESRGNWWHHYK